MACTRVSPACPTWRGTSTDHSTDVIAGELTCRGTTPLLSRDHQHPRLEHSGGPPAGCRSFGRLCPYTVSPSVPRPGGLAGPWIRRRSRKVPGAPALGGRPRVLRPVAPWTRLRVYGKRHPSTVGGQPQASRPGDPPCGARESHP
ncbi:unnamed protein product [Ixodes persulcatus]